MFIGCEMNTMKFAVCDDNTDELKNTELLLRSYCRLHCNKNIEIFCFENAETLIRHYNENDFFDVVIIDIYLSDCTGIDLAKKIREINPYSKIIFLTVSRDFAVDAFTVNATHYLVKPCTKDELFSALDKAISSMANDHTANMIFNVGSTKTKIDIKKILYFETSKHYQIARTIDDRQYSIRITNENMSKQISHFDCFFRCGRTYIVNMEYISEINSKVIVFDNGATLPMIRGVYQKLNDAYFAYIFKNNGEK